MLIELYKITEALPITITALYQAVLDSFQCRYTRWATGPEEDNRSGMMALADRQSNSDFEEAEEKLSLLAYCTKR